MKRIVLFFLGIIIYSLSLFATPVDDLKALFDDIFLTRKENVGFSFLKIPGDAKDIGIAESFTNDKYLLNISSDNYYNVLLSGMLLTNGDKFGNIEFFLKKNGYYVRLSTRYLNYGYMELRDSFPTSSYTAYSPNAFSSVVSMGYLMNGIFFAEGSAGIVRENDIEDYGMYFFNAKVMYKIKDNLISYVSFENLGGRAKVYNNSVYSVELPFTYRFGLDYSIRLKKAYNCDLYTSIIKYSDRVSQIALGGELSWKNLSLMLGGRLFHDSFKFSSGISLIYNNLQISYSVVPLTESIGIWHILSINLIP